MFETYTYQVHTRCSHTCRKYPSWRLSVHEEVDQNV